MPLSRSIHIYDPSECGTLTVHELQSMTDERMRVEELLHSNPTDMVEISTEVSSNLLEAMQVRRTLVRGQAGM